MELYYQLAAGNVSSPTSWQGDVQSAFRELKSLGYAGVELMVPDPAELDQKLIQDLAEDFGMNIGLICTGEIYGSLGLSYTDPDAAKRAEAIRLTLRIIDFAHALGADINIGRIRGTYRRGMDAHRTEALALEAFCTIADYARPLGVRIALEAVTSLQTDFINTLSEAQSMVGQVGRDNFMLMIDIFHAHIEEPDLIQAIRRYAPECMYVHLADNNRRSPGSSGLDFERIIRAFYESGYRGRYSLETLQLPDMHTAAAQSIAHLEPIFKRVYGL